MKSTILLIGLAALAPYAGATIVYSNTTTDTGGTVFYSTGLYTQIGDQLALAGTERSANSATAEFFDNGASGGTFDATLRFFNVGSPVGTQIGSGFTMTGNSISSSGILNVSWNLGGLVLPGNVVFTISISTVAAGLDLGLTLFEPPTVGSSANTFYITNNGSTFSQTSQGNTQDNVYFSLDASAVTIPEPGTMLLTLLGIPALALIRRRTL
jgi:hypothetical protein